MIGKLNTGVLVTALFVMFFIYAFQLVKFYKSKEKINEMFSKYIMYFFIVNFGILILKGLHLFQIFKFDYTEIIEEVICLIISSVVLVKEKIAEVKKKKEEQEKKKKKDEETEKEEKNKLFDLRKPQSDALIKLLEDDRDNSMILINGEWGIGKTFFVEKTLKMSEISENIEKIFIDVMLFNSRKSLKDELFGEIEIILENNAIAAKSIKEMNNYMDSIIESENKLINLALNFLKSKTFKKGKDGVEEAIKKLEDKKIIVVIDNLERVLKKEDVIEIMGFLHEIQSIEKISFIVCADKEKLKKMLEDDNYVEKFFLQEIELREVEALEIVDKIGERKEYLDYRKNLLQVFEKIKEKIENSISEIKENMQKILQEIEKLKESIKTNEILNNESSKMKVIESRKTLGSKTSEYEKIEKSYKLICKFNKLITVPRKIEKIYEEINRNVSLKNIYGKKLISFERYDEILVRASIIQAIFEVEHKMMIEENKYIEIMDYQEYSKNKSEENNGYKMERLLIKTEIGFWSIIIDGFEKIEKKAYLRILENKQDDKEIIDSIDKINKDDIVKDFYNLGKYLRYYEIEDKSIEKYRKVRSEVFSLKKEEYIDVISISEIIELEKRYLLEAETTEKSIFTKIEEFKFAYISNDKELRTLRKNFVEVYNEEFKILFTFVLKIKEETYDEYTYQLNGIKPFLKNIINMMEKSEIIEELKKKEYWEESEILKVEKMILDLFNKEKLEGKNYLKKRIEQFFRLSKEILKYFSVEEEKENTEKVNMNFKDMSDSEQIDTLNKIKNNYNLYYWENLKQYENNIKYGAKLDYYIVLNEFKKKKKDEIRKVIAEINKIKEDKLKTDNQ